MTLLGEAIALASDVHRNQVDKAGAPYILHPLEVMRRATDYYLANSDGYRLEYVQVAAVLHDTLEDIDEDSSWARGRLKNRIRDTFGPEVSNAVEALTKRTAYNDGYREFYRDYLTRVESDWIARVVKIADLSHNLDAFRTPTNIGEAEFERWDKYHRALVRLLRAGEVIKV
jgi:(p)ppGpp synthase/HD superfamily hydrolase